MREQGIKQDGGVTLEDDVWLGAKTTVLGGVTIHKGSIAGTSSLVNRSLPEYSICAGIPAKVIRKRTDK